jgi:hypothetical protein
MTIARIRRSSVSTVSNIRTKRSRVRYAALDKRLFLPPKALEKSWVPPRLLHWVLGGQTYGDERLVQTVGTSGSVRPSAMTTEKLTYVVWQVGLLVQPVPEVHHVLLCHVRVLLDLLAHALQLFRRWPLQCHGVTTCTYTMPNSCYCPSALQ